MKHRGWQYAGFTLLEVVVASAVMSVGTLAVFTLYLQLQAQPAQLNARYQDLQAAQESRPDPLFAKRWSALGCEAQRQR